MTSFQNGEQREKTFEKTFVDIDFDFWPRYTFVYVHDDIDPSNLEEDEVTEEKYELTSI